MSSGKVSRGYMSGGVMSSKRGKQAKMSISRAIL